MHKLVSVREIHDRAFIRRSQVVNNYYSNA